ncbi:MAG: 50S ribosomal protein L5 [bacterium]
MATLEEKYKNEILSALKSELKLKSVMQAPKLEKIILNIGVGEAIQNAKALDGAVSDLTWITGQKPIVTRAKRSIAGFKLRAGMPIGCKVTLRGTRMYEFLDRLVSVALPRVRDFKGISPKSFDRYGNYSLGIKEQIIFPEINYDKIDKLRGMNISFVTTAGNNEEARLLLGKLGLPFRK